MILLDIETYVTDGKLFQLFVIDIFQKTEPLNE